MEEENEEGMVEVRDHSTVVAALHMVEEMMEDAADRGLLDMVVAAWVPPPAIVIKPYSIRGG